MLIGVPSSQQRVAQSGGGTIVALTTVESGTWTVPAGVSSVDVLLVAGGGGGGKNWGGGGGAGRVLYSASFAVTAGADLNYTVGGGGAGSPSSSDSGTNGDNTTFDTLTALGGGGGGSHLRERRWFWRRCSRDRQRRAG